MRTRNLQSRNKVSHISTVCYTIHKNLCFYKIIIYHCLFIRDKYFLFKDNKRDSYYTQSDLKKFWRIQKHRINVYELYFVRKLQIIM